MPKGTNPKKNKLDKSELIKLSGEYASVQTKTTLSGLVTTWKELDQVGVYCAEAKYSGGVVGVKNAPFTVVTETLSSLFTGTMFWGAGSHNFYAYYPYNAANATIEAAAIPITLNSTQTQSGNSLTHIGALDFLVATPKAFDPMVDGAATPVNLIYNHIFSMIEFKVVIPLGTTKLTKIEMATSGANNLSLTSGIIDITQVKPTGDNPYLISAVNGLLSNTLNITGDCIVTNDPATSGGAMMVVLSGNHIGSNFTVNAYTDLKGVTTVTRDGVNIKRNHKYNLTITIPFIDLKTANRFGILSGVEITNSGLSIINDMDVGISPGLRAAIAGLTPTNLVNGAIYAPDDAPATATMLTQAKTDLVAAYDAAANAITPPAQIISGDIGGQILTPGIYKSTSTLKIETGNLTLDAQGNTNAFWVFQIASSLTTIGGAGGDVLLINGAQAKNIFWQVGSSATLGSGTSFKGNILALTSITMNNGAIAQGRMLARNGAVVLSSANTINKP
ncbi:MAG: ice-binding family protein [Bacteroidales bacterium]